MGMTDKQFNAFLRFLMDLIKEIKDAKTPAEKDAKADEIIERIQIRSIS